ncbi:PIKK family atypical protein kinase [Tritrichomonas foetus]|uniref:Serine/threonine-protein kinase TOR n=1 Tax=Tritrichomonas foetus TaxID=1144522 RepID=A0A1J4L2V2_9EUKA|nr:PIKK family atypical protein kinase [Tritrichomonas foetus]|eukprot:OHT17424.1 PIKK family atypical protein kinase [Tritrichomonas foetus]
MNEQRPLLSFDNVYPILLNSETFTEVRQKSLDYFSKLFLTSSEACRNNFPSNLFRWSTNKLHSRQQEARLAALAGFSFYVDIDDDQSNLLNIVQSLERILPLEIVILIEGIAKLVKRIARRVQSPIVPHLFDRSVAWLSFVRDTRATTSAVISSLYLFLRLCSFDQAFFKKYSNELNTIIITALTYQSTEIQQAAVALNRKIIEFDPAANEYVSALITNILIAINGELGMEHPQGFFLLISSFFSDNKYVCADRASDLFPIISEFMMKYPKEEYLPFLAELCETLPAEANLYSDKIFRVFLNSSKINFNIPSICQTFSRIVKKLPDVLCVFANDISFSLIPQSPNSFFIILKVVIECMPNIVDKRFALGAFETSKWSIYLADAAIAFAKSYSSYTFKLIHIFTQKLVEINEVSLSFLAGISFLDQFPLLNFWNSAYDTFYHTQENSLKVASIHALTSIIKRFKQQEQAEKMFHLLTQVQAENSHVQKAFLDSIDDTLLYHFANPANFIIVQQIYGSDEYSVSYSALKLIEKIRNVSPISTMNFFFTQLHQLPDTYNQIPSKYDQMILIKILPQLISCSGDFIDSHSEKLLAFLLNVLNSRLVTSMCTVDCVKELNNMRWDRGIRILAMHCIASLAGCITDMTIDVINALVEQLLRFRHKKVQLAATQTLRILFRKYPLVKKMDSKEIVKLHQSLFAFVKTSQSPEVNEEMLKLFGTIGSLDPYEFHTPHSQEVTGEVYSLYDRSKREQSYLNFVMKYILGQLKDNSKTHDLFVLINAVVYIFQSDASKCLNFLEEVVSIFTTILDRPNAQIQPGELFPSFKTIVLVVDIEILPHADAIYKLVTPYITEKHDLDALKLLNALIFSLKTNFSPYGPTTFATISSLLEEEQSGTDMEVTIMLTLTLLVIFAGGSSNIFFDFIYRRALANNMYSSPYAITFLTQALRSAPLRNLVVPSLRLSLILIEKSDICRESAYHLLQLLVIRFPDIMSHLPLDPQLIELMRKINTDPNYQANVYTFLQNYDPVPDQHTILSMPVMTLLPLGQIFGRGRLQSSVSENDWSAWLLQLTQELVLCSNSPAIRASHPLLRLSPEFEAELFPFVIVSVWDIALESDRNTLSNYLLGIVHNVQTPPEILSVIVAACDAMDRANFALFKDPFVSGQIAERCNSWFRALRFFEKALSKTIEPTSHLLRIHSLLKRKESALGLLNIAVSADSNCELLEALSMWSQARDVYEKKFNENPRNETFLAGYLNSSMYLEDWSRIEKRVNDFSTYTRDLQPKVAMIFAAAMRNTGGDPSKFLKAIKTDDPSSCTWRAIVALDQNNLEAADKWILRGLSLLCKDMSPFASGSYEPAIPTICQAMMLEELKDITDQRRDLATADQILNMWNFKADYVKRDATQLRSVYRVRELLQCSTEQLFTIHLDFVDSLRKLKEWTLFDNSFRRLFEGNDDDRVKLMRAKFLFDRGIISDLTEISNIIEKLKNNQEKTNVYCDAILSYVSRCHITPTVLPLLNDVLELQPKRVRAWKHWAYFNLGCAQPSENGDVDESSANFASNAMKGFAMLIKLTGPSLHFLCQLCALFFTYGPRLSNFSSGAENLTSLEPSSVIQIIPQLMVQFDHPNESVRKVVYNIVRVFAEDHFQALSMPLCLVKRTPSSSKALLDFIDQMGHEHHELMRDAETFTAGMLQIAVTSVEEVIVLLEKAISLIDCDVSGNEVSSIIYRIYTIFTQEHRSFVYTIFQDQKVQNFMNRLIKLNNTNTSNCHLGNAATSTKAFLQMKMETVTTIDITEMGFSLCNASSFSLAVPGFYSVDKVPVTIDSIGHVLKLIPSAKRPRKLRILGSDGRTYKYLLKGREDLRLDQRVMQLFSLTNSILHDDKFGIERHLHIKQVPIVPIAPNAGLIAWAEGGETIYSMISWHRRIVGIDNNEEQVHLKNYVGDDSTIAGDKESTLRLSMIQKLELHRELCALALDDDIRETMWLRSPNAEQWLSQNTNFARSNGLMSMIGYLIGIGDRHPSNILVMKGTGNVVHIDFSDVFEKASMRAFVRETVPFRLTRMLVRALGASGIHGVFEMTAEYVMTLMRRNKETLLAFLDIFIQDPITDTLWYRSACEGEEGSTLRKAIARVSDKLNGREFDQIQLNVHDQVHRLIGMATSEMNLAQMYYGWAPFW